MRIRDWRIGVLKWFNAQKGADGLGYVVTNEFGFERWNKGTSDFVELPFTSACCSRGVPSERSIVAFCISRDRRIIALRPLEFNASDFKLVLRYEAHQQPLIRGKSNKSKSEWQCNIHILSALLQHITKTEETLSQVREWMESYLEKLSERERVSTINAWLADEWLGKRLNVWMPTIDGLSHDISTSSHDCLALDKYFPLFGTDSCIETKDLLKKGESPMTNNVVLRQKPASLQAAANDVLHDMYVSKVGNRLNELDSPSDEDRRRWIWELIQNAKDSIAGDVLRKKVSVELIIRGDTVVFNHNGAPFNPKNRLGLLYQYSKDKRNQEGSTGRFGTGFMTTHCLSRVVEVQGDVLTPDEGVRGFTVTIHREGNTEDEMINGLKAMEDSDRCYERPFGKTTYTYHVKSDSGRRAIELGVGELKRQICKVMCFCPELDSVSVYQDNRIFAVKQSQSVCIAEGVDSVSFQVQDGEHAYTRTFIRASIKENGCELLTKKYDRERSLSVDVLLEIDESTHSIVGHTEEASVFCVFPVIGIEHQLQEPLFINSPDFELTTERNGLYLSGVEVNDNGRPSNVAVNKMIFEKVVILYGKIVAWLSQNRYEKLYLLAEGLNSIKGDQNLDCEWYKENVQIKYRKALLEYKVAKPVTDAEYIDWLSLSECSTVWSGDDENIAKMLELMADFKMCPDVKCQIADNNEWIKRLWEGDDIQKWSVTTLSSFIAQKGNLDSLPLKDNIDRVSWYNKFLSLVIREDKSILENYQLVPDMKGGLHSTSDESLEQVEGAEANDVDFVIQLMKRLGNDVSSSLMHTGIKGIKLDRKFNSTRYSSEINKLVETILNDEFKSVDQKLNDIAPLLEILPGEKRCNAAFVLRRIKTNEVLKRLSRNSGVGVVQSDALLELAWKSCDEWLCKQIPTKIAMCKSIKGLIDAKICSCEEEAFDILNVFYRWIDVMGDGVASDSFSVFPNQHGTFMAKGELSREASPIDEKIKDFVAALNTNDDFRCKLIDVRCRIVKIAREITFQAVCNKLDELVINGKSSRKSENKYRDVVRELLDDWKESNQQYFTATFFPNVYINYSDLELEVVHTTEERKLANDLLKSFTPPQLRELIERKQIQPVPSSLHDDGASVVCVSVSDGQYAGLSKEEQTNALIEAKKLVMAEMKQQGYAFENGICEEKYSIIDGVKKEGVSYPLVVHSYLDDSRQFQLNASDWEQLLKPHSMLIVRTQKGICSVPFRDLVCNREKINFSISTEGNLEMGDRIKNLAYVLRWFRGLRFDFGSLIPMNTGVAQLFNLPENLVPENQKPSQLSPDDEEEVM